MRIGALILTLLTVTSCFCPTMSGQKDDRTKEEIARGFIEEIEGFKNKFGRYPNHNNKNDKKRFYKIIDKKLDMAFFKKHKRYPNELNKNDKKEQIRITTETGIYESYSYWNNYMYDKKHQKYSFYITKTIPYLSWQCFPERRGHDNIYIYIYDSQYGWSIKFKGRRSYSDPSVISDIYVYPEKSEGMLMKDFFKKYISNLTKEQR